MVRLHDFLTKHGVACERIHGNRSQAQRTEALADLEPLLEVSQRIWVFGEPFQDGLGVHNIHQNQGDPLDSQWSAENGIWQDGATLVQRQDGSFALFCNKFVTQSVRTDENGKPRK